MAERAKVRPRRAHPEQTPPETVELDDVDKRILRLLADDARLSIRAIARQIAMSPGAVTERMERLQRRGVILGYHAEIDPRALGYRLQAVVGLQTAQGPSLSETLDRIMTVPEVEAIHVVTGQWDLVLRLRVKDHFHLRHVVLDKIWQMPGFRHSETMIVYETRERPAGWSAALVSPAPN